MSNTISRDLRVLSIRSEVEPIDPNEVPLVVSEIMVQWYFQVATITALVYNVRGEHYASLDYHAILRSRFNFQAKYFWKVPQRMVDYVYFLNRYAAIFRLIAFLFCEIHCTHTCFSKTDHFWY
ncbi:hypothetical protein ACEPAF_10008 [Sanghuangporus sanghuang]